MPEILQKKEPTVSQEDAQDSYQDLQKQQVLAMVQQRSEMLGNIKSTLSKKLFFALEDKLQKEQQEMEKLLGFQQGREEILSQYTFILDSQYFDQIFLKT